MRNLHIPRLRVERVARSTRPRVPALAIGCAVALAGFASVVPSAHAADLTPTAALDAVVRSVTVTPPALFNYSQCWKSSGTTNGSRLHLNRGVCQTPEFTYTNTGDLASYISVSTSNMKLQPEVSSPASPDWTPIALGVPATDEFAPVVIQGKFPHTTVFGTPAADFTRDAANILGSPQCLRFALVACSEVAPNFTSSALALVIRAPYTITNLTLPDASVWRHVVTFAANPTAAPLGGVSSYDFHGWFS